MVLHVLFLGTEAFEPVGETVECAGWESGEVSDAAGLLGPGPPVAAGGEGAGGLAEWRGAALWRTALPGTHREEPGAGGTSAPALWARPPTTMS